MLLLHGFRSTMPGPIAQRLSVTPAQHEILRALARQHTAPQRLVRRVRVILAAAEGLGLTDGPALGHQSLDRPDLAGSLARASERLSAARDDRQALAQAIEETLSEAPRSGTPPTFSAKQVAQP